MASDQSLSSPSTTSSGFMTARHIKNVYDEVDELIAAGESVIQCRYHKQPYYDLNLCKQTFEIPQKIYGIQTSDAHLKENSSSDSNFDIPKLCLQNMSGSSDLSEENSSIETSIKSNLCNENSSVNQNSNIEEYSEYSISTSLGTDHLSSFTQTAKDDVKSNYLISDLESTQQISNGISFSSDTNEPRLSLSSDNNDEKSNTLTSLKTECASILALSLSMASSLSNANRLLSSLAKSQTLSSSFEKNLLQEISLCEKNCKENESNLEQMGINLQHYLMQFVNEEKEFQFNRDQMKKLTGKSTSLLCILRDLMSKMRIGHLIPAVNSPRPSCMRAMDELDLGLSLLCGEITNNSHFLLKKNKTKEKEEKLNEKIIQLENEMESIQKKNLKEISSHEIQLEIHIKRTRELEREISAYEEEISQLEIALKNQMKMSEDEITSLKQQVIRANEESQRKTSASKYKLLEMNDSINGFKAQIKSLKEQITVKESHIHTIQTETAKYSNSIRETIENLSKKVEREKCKVNEVSRERCHWRERFEKQEELMADAEAAKITSMEDSANLHEELRLLRESQYEDVKELEQRLDARTSVLCDKESALRSCEVEKMQMQTNYHIEQQRVVGLKMELESQDIQVSKLKDKVAQLLEFLGKKHSDLPSLFNSEKKIQRQDSGIGIVDEKVVNELQESLIREEKLLVLIKEKDEEIRKLQESFRSQLSLKNGELDTLGESIIYLEKHMESIVSDLNISRDLANISCEAVMNASETSERVDKLQLDSQKMQREILRVNRESNSSKVKSDTLTDANHDLNLDLRASRKLIRDTRVDFCKAKMEAQDWKQKCTLMQIDLDSSRVALEEMRMERGFRNESSLKGEELLNGTDSPEVTECNSSISEFYPSN